MFVLIFRNWKRVNKLYRGKKEIIKIYLFNLIIRDKKKEVI